jgi:hypothetical protein
MEHDLLRLRRMRPRRSDLFFFVLVAHFIGCSGTDREPDPALADAGEAPTRDAGEPGEVRDEVVSCLSTAVARATRTQRLEFAGADVSVGLVRYVDPDGIGTSGTVVWIPERFALARGAEAECIADAQQLAYSITHHNFQDTMSATRDGITWTVSFDVMASVPFAIEAKDGARSLWGPVSLNLVRCRELENDRDCTDGWH